MKLEFCRVIFEIYSDWKFLKIRPVWVQFHADRETDGDAGTSKPVVFFFSILWTRKQIRGGNRSAFGWEFFHTKHARECGGWYVKMHLNTGTEYSLDVELV